MNRLPVKNAERQMPEKNLTVKKQLYGDRKRRDLKVVSDGKAIKICCPKD